MSDVKSEKSSTTEPEMKGKKNFVQFSFTYGN